MTTPAGGTPYGYGYQTQIDIGWLTRGWDTFKANAGTWIGLLLLVGLILLPLMFVIALVTGYAGIIAYTYNTFINGMHGVRSNPVQPPNMLQQYGSSALFSIFVGGITFAGFGCYYQLALDQLRGRPATIGTALSALRRFPSLFAAGVIVQFVTTIGFYLCYLPGLIAQGLFMFVPLVIVDRGVGALAALTEGVNLVKSQWLMAALFYFLGQLLAGVGGLLCGVGAFVTYPLFMLGVAMAYLALAYPSAPPPPQYGAASAGVWPPPPQATPPAWEPPPGQAPPPNSPPRRSLSGEPLDDGTPPGAS